MPTSWAFASSVCSALLLAGCGGGPELTAVSFHAESGLQRVQDRRTGGSAEPVPTFRAGGGPLTFVVHVRNTGSERVTVAGPVRDEPATTSSSSPPTATCRCASGSGRSSL